MMCFRLFRFLLRRTFPAAVSLWIGCLAAGSVAAAAEPDSPLFAYVGTFSSPLQNVRATQVDLPPGNGRGIHIFQVDRVTGALTPRGVLEQGTSPSCLARNAAGTRLYSANETDRDAAEAGSVTAFSINRADGKLTPLNTVTSGGKGPTFVSVHPSGKFVLVANYFGGSVAVLPILPDGGLSSPADLQKSEGAVGPNTATNAPSGSFAHSGHDQTHAHMIQADPTGGFVLSVDLGLDRLFSWKLDTGSGKLTPNAPHGTSLPPGDGPRHFAWHPGGEWLYSLQEEASNVVFFGYDRDSGKLDARQTISTLPPGFEGSSFGSEILVSPDGKFLYAGNRLHDSIAIFSIAASGALEYLGEEWTRGNYPRSFAFTPDGGFLHCCNQRGDNVTSFRVDRRSGGLTHTGKYTAVGNPSMILFLDTAQPKRE